MRNFILVIFLINACTEKPIDKLEKKSPDTFRIAFGSCNKVGHPQPLWSVISESVPDLWIWLGDIIYADTENMDSMKAMYNRQKNLTEYKTFAQKTPIVGIWDDHDFGKDNGGKDYLRKKESQQLLLDFLDEPQNNPRRKQEGVYTSYVYRFHENSIKVILLDTRYFRDDPGEESDILGETQWAWLENELATDSADVTILESSIQILPRDHWREKWSRFPKSRDRLLKLLKQYHKPGLILISGDRHYGEISKYEEEGLSLYEITSSGLTHHKWSIWFYLGLENNRYRLGEPWVDLNFGLIDIDFKRKNIILYIVDQNGFIRSMMNLPV